MVCRGVPAGLELSGLAAVTVLALGSLAASRSLLVALLMAKDGLKPAVLRWSHSAILVVASGGGDSPAALFYWASRFSTASLILLRQRARGPAVRLSSKDATAHVGVGASCRGFAVLELQGERVVPCGCRRHEVRGAELQRVSRCWRTCRRRFR